MRPRSVLLVAALLFGVQYAVVSPRGLTTAPTVIDAAENLNIGQSLAAGRGYRFDWDQPAFRRAFADQARADPARAVAYGRVLAHHGSYATLARPPLWPVLLAGLLWVDPRQPDVFAHWRLLDMALAAAAGGLLCDAAARAAGPDRHRVAVAVAVLIFAFDPIRWFTVPGWWTEGLAFDLTAVGCWLMVVAPRPVRSPGRYAAAAGVTLGLLCLDRPMVVLLVPPLAWLLAGPNRPVGRLRSAAAIAAVAVAVQLPWWARNVAGGRSFVPLGTQGGYNLPDEYGPAVVRSAGYWDGTGIRDALFPPGRPVPDPPGYAARTLDQIAPGDRAVAAVVVAYNCTSTASELAVSRAGTRAAVDWVRHHPGQLPGLFVRKVGVLVEDHRKLLAAAVGAVALGYWRSPRDRRTLAQLLSWAAAYVAGVGVTHVFGDRFLVPLLPPLYVAVAVAAAAILRPADRPVAGGSVAP